MSAKPPSLSAALTASALVVGAFGRHCLIETEDGQRLIAHPRGKKNQAVVGDRVQWLATGDEASIERLQPRRNLFYRQDDIRTKSFAANLDRVLILIAAEPEFSESQLARALVAAEAERITPVIALNKRDLAEPFARAWARPEVTMRSWPTRTWSNTISSAKTSPTSTPCSGRRCCTSAAAKRPTTSSCTALSPSAVKK